MGTTASISQFVSTLRLSEVPADAQQVAVGGMLDSIACAVAGTRTPVGRTMVRWTKGLGAPPVAGVIGGGYRSSPEAAARANGTIGQALDYDPPVALLPVVLSLSEARKCSGVALLEAYIAGFEVQSKLQAGCSTLHTQHGWHSITVFGTLGAAAAASKLIGLDRGGTQMALGIACSQSAGLMQNLGTMTKPLHAGFAASNGVLAALLAEAGFTSAPDAIEGEFGLLRVIATEGEYDEKSIGHSFGAPWNLLSHGIRFKPYPCCRWAHRPLDAALALVREQRISPSSIERIECEISSHVPGVMAFTGASTSLEAKFCLAYCLAVAVADGAAGLEQFSESRVQDPTVHELAKRVVLKHSHGSELDHKTMLPCAVRIVMADGTVHEKGTGHALGDPQNPIGRGHVVQKLAECAHHSMAERDVSRLVELVESIASQESVEELCEILTFKVA